MQQLRYNNTTTTHMLQYINFVLYMCNNYAVPQAVHDHIYAAVYESSIEIVVKILVLVILD